ncbi:hypothetical protein ColLi_13014 [Colletotrichum liriopes]|uniref:Uncharacterized protein n=1 Tax=Colletotrichum liriopes TaxID=708192 RepID=A0AA37M039_9PEZI|nr:hypothetical protein ColLi_13014 [Colletotrichum liriopes]
MAAESADAQMDVAHPPWQRSREPGNPHGGRFEPLGNKQRQRRSETEQLADPDQASDLFA